ncbi:glutamate dehydrogenase (NADP+) [Parelusimicrobium proximum]|uniref:NADP-specific glutamate dehydrogenase n=1 Tax=Parelusimicrobium proximum TaxID=3228953 RepID=UPI003D18599D
MTYISDIIEQVKKRDPHQKVFHQAVEEVLTSLQVVLDAHPEYQAASILERLVEPERVITFRVPWQDDSGKFHVNRGVRVQFNSAIGPYKGGIRFHPSVNAGVLKFLGFEQTLKNALTSLPMGGGKGGSDFNPIGRSDSEVMRFCQSFMTELFRYIGPNTDVPAGDLGVGAREIGYMFGQYKKIANEFTGVLTGKGPTWGGSKIRPEATGYGVVYFTEAMLGMKGDTFKGKTCIISGAGNVGLHTIEKVNRLGGKVVGFATWEGFVYDKDGVYQEKVEFLKDLLLVKRGSVEEYVKQYKNAVFTKDKKVWSIPCDIAFPTAKENELDLDDAKMLIKNGCKYVVEGANMPCTAEAIDAFREAKVLFAPGKAANAGGVSVSGLEMTQNSLHLSWSAEEVDRQLMTIMKNIHDACFDTAIQYGMKDNYVAGANIAGFKKVATAMLQQGLV